MKRQPIWKSDRSHQWLSDELRSTITAFFTDFMTEHLWARTLVLEERFADTGVHVRVRRQTPVQPSEPLDTFLQRPGVPYIRVLVIRDRDSRKFESSVSFIEGNQVTPVTLSYSLQQLRLSLRALELQARQ